MEAAECLSWAPSEELPKFDEQFCSDDRSRGHEKRHHQIIDHGASVSRLALKGSKRQPLPPRSRLSNLQVAKSAGTTRFIIAAEKFGPSDARILFDVNPNALCVLRFNDKVGRGRGFFGLIYRSFRRDEYLKVQSRWGRRKFNSIRTESRYVAFSFWEEMQREANNADTKIISATSRGLCGTRQ